MYLVIFKPLLRQIWITTKKAIMTTIGIRSISNIEAKLSSLTSLLFAKMAKTDKIKLKPAKKKVNNSLISPILS